MNAISTLPSSGDVSLSQSPVSKATTASREFESVLLGQWLQQAESSFGTVPGNEEDDAGGGEMKEFAMQHLAAEIVRRGGIGIANMVESALASSTGLNNNDVRPGTSSIQEGR